MFLIGDWMVVMMVTHKTQLFVQTSVWFSSK